MLKKILIRENPVPKCKWITIGIRDIEKRKLLKHIIDE